MKVLVDTNIVLDALLEREPFVNDARLLMEAIRVGDIDGYVSATTITNIFYIVRKQTKSIDLARDAVSRTLTLMEISSVDRHQLEVAFSLNYRDFEEAVQLTCAIADDLDAIVTRDREDFVSSTVSIVSISELPSS